MVIQHPREISNVLEKMDGANCYGEKPLSVEPFHAIIY